VITFNNTRDVAKGKYFYLGAKCAKKSIPGVNAHVRIKGGLVRKSLVTMFASKGPRYTGKLTFTFVG